MTFPRHRQYAEIKVADLPPLPQHWQPSLLKRWITVRSGDMISSSEETQEGFPLIGGNGIRAYTTKKNTLANTLVIGRVGAKCGCIHYIEEDFWASEHAFRVIEKRLLSKRFFFHLLTALNLNQFAIKTAQPLLNTEIVETQWIGTPPIDEQELIGKFLDHETAKIDALISEQERLIELLQEKRQAVISHAVTKGLNPNAPMKDSGVEWLGEVPEHWGVMKMKNLVEVKDGTHATPDYVEQEKGAFPLITSKDFIDDEINFEEAKYISKEDHAEITKRSNTEKDDVLMSMIGGNIGKALIVKTDQEFSIKNVALFKARGNILISKLILYYLRSGLLEIQLKLVNRGGAQAFLGLGDIRNLVLPQIPEDEIKELIQKLDSRVGDLNQLITIANDFVHLLDERRSALISAAVTGQIDVRGLVSEEEAA